MNVMRAILKTLLGVLVLVALPFLVEVILNAYELNRNPWTKPSAIVTDGGPVRPGLNRRQFNEIRFRSTGMRMFVTAADLSHSEAESLVSEVRGTFEVLQAGETVYAYPFVLEENLRRNVGGLDAMDTLLGAPSLDIARKYDVECRIVPASEAHAATAHAFFTHAFEARQPVEFALTFVGSVPERTTLRFAYSQAPRSLFHGTFLSRLAARLTRSNL